MVWVHGWEAVAAFAASIVVRVFAAAVADGGYAVAAYAIRVEGVGAGHGCPGAQCRGAGNVWLRCGGAAGLGSECGCFAEDTDEGGVCGGTGAVWAAAVLAEAACMCSGRVHVDPRGVGDASRAEAGEIVMGRCMPAIPRAVGVACVGFLTAFAYESPWCA